MIVEIISNSLPYLYTSGMAIKVVGEGLPEIIEPIELDFCFCKYECEYKELVFAKVAGEDFENDKRSFIFQRLVAADTIVMKLWFNGVEVATLNNNTYGIFYDFGDITQQTDYKGYLFDFEKAFAIHGGGEYQIKTDTNIIGVATTIESQIYTCMPYSEEAADNTVKIEWYQNGNILSSLFDFTDINWYQAVRIHGQFGKKKPTLEKDFYVTQERKRQQIQDNILTTYELNTKLIPSDVSNQLYYNMCFANQIFITDYNLFNNEIFRYKEVDTDSFGDPKYFGKQTKAIHSLVFTEKYELDKKRNF